ncbi:Multidrug resistance protein MdtA [Anatilimnocola aggregata]|uniref:Multidrug resistance protein MdtA n=1 Tax=Anatilimnocola aggregata TaxID=2528021 RepID=A0A517Y9L8_9BACT|nr:efflux RND transporter periplasmic adaptor subunit [Anatilimnocola aggregata]QDU26929.1 Multidrug resistance protein MdtA [Anatilimnocola aggregata]
MSQKILPANHRTAGRTGPLMIVIVVVAACATAAVFQQFWLPQARQLLNSSEAIPTAAEPGKQANEGRGESHAPHESPNSIQLSAQARKNIGLTDEFIQPIKLESFQKTISVPGMVIERPGRSVVEVTAPLTGVIMKIFPIEGESLAAGSKLFELRLTHEELVQTQAALLETVEELEVIKKEIARLEKLAADGAIPGKRIIEQKYEQQKREASLRSKRQALLLHGLTNEQVSTIIDKRELFRDLTVTVPTVTEDGSRTPAGTIFQVQGIKVAQGQQVEAGTTLATLADHAELYIEGEAFECDVADISQAADQKAAVTAVLEADGGQREVIEGLQVLYLATKIEPTKRTLDFFVTLPNRMQRDFQGEEGRRFYSWRFRPGQRVQLEIPVETLPNRIVLPIEAIAQDGTETYVFSPNGDQFERRSVHVEYRDARRAVIASDGSLFPGDRVALRAAQQLQVAIKNKSGGAPDPHAGHSH